MTKGEAAYNNFLSGMTCSQSVLCAFLDEAHIDRETAMRIAMPFGGGMGRLRLTCGTVTGMIMAYGLIKGLSSVPSQADKAENYKGVQTLVRLFEEANGSCICAELLGLKKAEVTHVPQERTAEYYKKRPCPELCRSAADILESYLKNS